MRTCSEIVARAAETTRSVTSETTCVAACAAMPGCGWRPCGWGDGIPNGAAMGACCWANNG